MYGIRLNPEGQHVKRGTTTSARDSQSQAGSRQYLGSKRVTENYQYASFTEYNNNEVLSGSSNSSSSLLSERMLPDGGGMLSRSTYSRSTMLSDTRIAHSAIIGSSTMRKETASSSAFSSTVGSRRIMGHTHCSGSTRIPDVYLEAAEGGAECQSVRLQEEEAEFCIGKSAQPSRISFKCFLAAFETDSGGTCCPGSLCALRGSGGSLGMLLAV
ncbi:hypothetical protein E2C01_061335 [Portunus trituberculatus]|uniref:Uncharacterized protein n=1 Tax=Portunus trituberculatus TaxID=210409 RepID=A0A5B7HBE0_PORTR|nr:hypothetical protein [Portunus trituberculatus]